MNIDISEEKLSKVVESSEFGNMAAATAKVGGNSAEATSRFTAGGGQKGKWANHFSREEVGNFLDLKNGFVLADMNHVLYFAPYNI